MENMTREEKIKFLLSGERDLGIKYSDTYGDFSNIEEDTLNELVEELDWLWK